MTSVFKHADSFLISARCLRKDFDRTRRLVRAPLKRMKSVELEMKGTEIIRCVDFRDNYLMHGQCFGV